MSAWLTPGPWEVFTQGKGLGFCVGQDWTVGTAQIVSNLNEADARLIAAAPELFHALDTALRVLVENGLAEGAIGDDCFAALAKARGRQVLA